MDSQGCRDTSEEPPWHSTESMARPRAEQLPSLPSLTDVIWGAQGTARTVGGGGGGGVFNPNTHTHIHTHTEGPTQPGQAPYQPPPPRATSSTMYTP